MKRLVEKRRRESQLPRLSNDTMFRKGRSINKELKSINLSLSRKMFLFIAFIRKYKMKQQQNQTGLQKGNYELYHK